MNRTYFRFASVAVAVALTVAACGKGKSTGVSTTSTTAAPKDVEATAAALHAPSVQLRVKLSNLLESSSFLTSAVAALEVAQGPSALGGTASPGGGTASTTTSTTAGGTTAAPTTTTTAASTTASTTATTTTPLALQPAAAAQLPAAQAALDQNSQDLAAALDAAYPGIQAPFLAAWRQHLQAYAPFVRDVLAGDHTAQTADRTAITATTTQLATILNGVNPVFVVSAVSDAITTTVTAQETAITAIAGKTATQYDAVSTAASATLSLGEFLAHGIATHAPNSYAGNVDSKAAFLLVAAETSLIAHTYLAAQASRVAVYGGDAVAAKNTLDANSQAVANIVLVSYGAKAGADFLSAWRRQANAYVAYATAQAGANSSAASQARSDATAAMQQIAGQLASLNPGLPTTLAPALSAHVQAQLAVCDSQAAKQSSEYTSLTSAAAALPAVGFQLAEAVAEQYPGIYPGT